MLYRIDAASIPVHAEPTERNWATVVKQYRDGMSSGVH